jgi:hypothetical protein
MRQLPRPTAEQRAAFARHVCSVHSWYKHLPLLRGGEFVVFLSQDVDRGETLSERHGHLDYQWRVDIARSFDRDLGRALELSGEAAQRLGFVLYPYASDDANAPEAIGYDLHRADLAALESGARHPDRAAILEWAAATRAADVAWRDLDRSERDLTAASGFGDGSAATPRLSVFAQADQWQAAAFDALQSRQLAEVDAAISRLLRWLDHPLQR